MEWIILDDLFGVTLWGENIFRRVLHNFSGNNYNPTKTPLLFHEPMLQKETLDQIAQLPLPQKQSLNTTYFGKLEGHYSTKSTLYYHDFDQTTRDILVSIGEQLIPRLEELAKEELTMGNSDFKTMIIRYEGKESKFDMHYDAEHSDCYRVLILYKGAGVVPPFCYIKNGLQKVHLKEGEGIFFKGTQTYHGVFPSGNENTIRYMIGFQYRKKGTREQKSLCSELRKASLKKIMYVFLPYVLYYQTLTFYAPSYSPMLSLLTIAISYRHSVSFGAYPYSMKSILQFYFFILLCTAKPMLSLNICSYFLFSELGYPKHNPSVEIEAVE
jgi:hypothetical protein